MVDGGRLRPEASQLRSCQPTSDQTLCYRRPHSISLTSLSLQCPGRMQWRRPTNAGLAADTQTARLESKGQLRGNLCSLRATSTSMLLREMGMRGKAHRQAVKYLSGAAEKGSQWLWMKRKDPT
ncbi:hypothetical protein N1851_012376 [Merluccius polli]|uniref:Uncharacterized protein n=1 Tax=Merluccius polli TaxID=89951 RepID=A0AA47MXE5_MERPO|nr:hypothetical protein N1851_012376 [Merluccius polli]